jgi:hypothetical protein
MAATGAVGISSATQMPLASDKVPGFTFETMPLTCEPPYGIEP